MRGKIVRGLFGACCAWALLASTALAVDYTWNVNGPTNGWSQDSLHKNWNAGVAFPNSYSIDVFFGAVADAPIFVTSNMFVRNFTFGSSQVINNAGGGSLLLNDEDRVITVTNASDTAVIDTVLSGNRGFTKAGPGTLSLGGPSVYSGTVIINQGNLVATNGSALGSGSVTVNSGTKLQLNLTANTVNTSINGAGTVDVIGTGVSTVESGKMNSFQGTLNINTTGAGKMILRSAIGTNAVINVASGATLQTEWTITTQNLYVSGTGSSEGYGALRVDSTLAGLVNLQGPTTFSTAYNSSFSVLSAKVTGNYPLTTSTTWGRTVSGLKSPGGLLINSPDSDFPSLVIDNSDAIIAIGADATIVGGVITKGPLGTGPVTLSAGTLRNSYSTSSNIDNPIEVTNSAASKTLSALGSALYVRSNITGSGNLNVTSDVLPTGVVFSGDNSGFTGKFTLGPTGQLSVNDTIVLNSASSGSAAATWDIRGRLNLGFAGDGTVHLGALAGEKTADIQNTQVSPYFVKTLRVGALNTDTIYRGEFNATLREPLNLVKVGTGTLRMVPEETSTLTNTVIESGKLIVNNAGSSSSTIAYFNGPVTVNANTTLGGTATMNSVISVNSGGRIAPGDGVGVLSTLGQTWAGGTRFEMQTSTQGGHYSLNSMDVLLMNNGGLNLSAVSASNPVVVELISMSNLTATGLVPTWNPNNNATWQGFIRIPLGGMISGFSADKFIVDTSEFQNPLNGSFSVVQVSPIQLNLVYTANPIPEPSNVMLLLAGSGAGFVVWRRSKRKANAALCL